MVFPEIPAHRAYDIVIIGGAMMGASTAWWLTELGFPGRVLVVERDPSYEFSSTARSNSCIRQQFSHELNIRISQFGAEFVQNLPKALRDARAPELKIRNFGYLYLAGSDAAAEALRAAHEVQMAAGAGTRLLAPGEIATEWPFYDLTGVVLGSHNSRDEGYFDGITVFDWWRKLARERGIEFIAGEVVDIERSKAGDRVTGVALGSGEVLGCGAVVNAAGPRAARVAALLGIDLPVEPRKRYTWVFTAENPLEKELPLTIDPSGVHVRQDTASTYMAGGHADIDPAADFDDFAMDQSLWMDKFWPALAARIPAFEAVRVVNEWVGHYAYNTLDQNAVIGPHDQVKNFYFLNGFSGHGLQQSPAMGRGMAELLVHGEFRGLDLSEFGWERIRDNRPIVEKAVI